MFTVYLVLDATNEPVEAFKKKEDAVEYATKHGLRVMMIMVR